MVLADLITHALVRDAVLPVFGAAVVGLCAQVSFPLPSTPVPVTLQTFAVLVVGASLGASRATAAMLIYVLAGLVGVPWFAGGDAGWTGVSFGYLLGFVVSGAVMGLLSRRGSDRRCLTTGLQFLAGTIVIYAVGTLWLALDLHIGLARAVQLGVRPFLWFDLAKVVLASMAMPATWAAVRRVQASQW